MLRRLFALFSVLSLTVSVASCVAWAFCESQQHAVTLERFCAYSIICRNGVFVLEMDTNLRPHDRQTIAYSEHWRPRFDSKPDISALPLRLGFRHKAGHFLISMQEHLFDVRYCFVPCRAVLMVAAIAPLVAVIGRFVRVKRVRPGHCHFCGYDLRATTGRCPECGMAMGFKEPRTQ